MKAVFIDAHGGLDVMRYGELADPVCGETGVIVDVHAASVNAADSQSRRGEYFRAPKFPHILGRDFSGLVSEIGSRVTALRPGDAVFGVCDLGLEGAYAEKIALESALVTRKPETVTHVEAAAAALAWLTAIVSIEHTLKLKPGERILIQGGAGGVGSFAVQLSKHIGAHVIATARAVNHDYLRALGADEVIDYEEMDFRLATAACDAVFRHDRGSCRARLLRRAETRRARGFHRLGHRRAAIAAAGRRFAEAARRQEPHPPRANRGAVRGRIGASPCY